jgi:hypothetical protein
MVEVDHCSDDDIRPFRVRELRGTSRGEDGRLGEFEVSRIGSEKFKGPLELITESWSGQVLSDCPWEIGLFRLLSFPSSSGWLDRQCAFGADRRPLKSLGVSGPGAVLCCSLDRFVVLLDDLEI